MTGTVLLAARDSSDIDRLHDGLEELDMVVAPASTGAEALERAEQLKPDLVVLVLDLPDIHGLDVCRRLRRSSDVPLIVMAEGASDLDRVLALELGADDVIPSPCGRSELCERIRAALRRAVNREAEPAAGRDLLEFGDLVIDRRTHTLTTAGGRAQLTPMEMDLLWALANRPGEVLRSATLLREVWGYPEGVRTRTLDVHIGRVRRKLGEDGQDPRYIVTVRGVGYRFEPWPAGQAAQ